MVRPKIPEPGSRPSRTPEVGGLGRRWCGMTGAGECPRFFVDPSSVHREFGAEPRAALSSRVARAAAQLLWPPTRGEGPGRGVGPGNAVTRCRRWHRARNRRRFGLGSGIGGLCAMPGRTKPDAQRPVRRGTACARPFPAASLDAVLSDTGIGVPKHPESERREMWRAGRAGR